MLFFDILGTIVFLIGALIILIGVIGSDIHDADDVWANVAAGFLVALLGAGITTI